MLPGNLFAMQRLHHPKLASALLQLFIVAYCRLASASEASELFSVVQLAGVPQCSTDQPLVTHRARSGIECASQCLALNAAAAAAVGCAAFNFKAGVQSCELFNHFATNYTVMSGCRLYQGKANTPSTEDHQLY